LVSLGRRPSRNTNNSRVCVVKIIQD
jgi:hypothetical protein